MQVISQNSNHIIRITFYQMFNQMETKTKIQELNHILRKTVYNISFMTVIYYDLEFMNLITFGLFLMIFFHKNLLMNFISLFELSQMDNKLLFTVSITENRSQ